MVQTARVNPLLAYRGDAAAPRLGVVVNDDEAMEAAFEAALAALGEASPEPLAGCAIVDRGGVLASVAGHRGPAHAEALAIDALCARGERDRLQGARVFVTLEPCARESRAESCARMLTRWPIAALTFAAREPDPQSKGRGLQLLRAAGISCSERSSDAARALELAGVYAFDRRHRRALVGLKAATTLNGVLGSRCHGQQWITGPSARRYGHLLRLWYDAIAVGRGTVETDNPTLNPRLSPQLHRTPLRLIVDTRATLAVPEVLKRLNVVRHEPEKTLWILGADLAKPARDRATGILHDAGVDCVSIERLPQGDVNLAELLRALYQRDIRSVLVEGGAGLYRSFLQQRQVDRLHLFQASSVRVDPTLLHWLDGGIETELRLDDVEIVPLCPDWLVQGAVRERECQT